MVAILVGVILLIGFILKSNSDKSTSKDSNGTVAEADYKNAEYIIDGRSVKLVNGLLEEEEVSGSAGKIITRYFGNDLVVDLNDDGRDDVVFYLTQESGGSGVFYYVAAALNTVSGYLGSQALFLGDRIAPQPINKGEGKIVVVNYMDRAKDEPFTTAPSNGKSLWLKYDEDTNQFGEVVQNFEGEASADVMTLTMKPWSWISATQASGDILVPNMTEAFKLTFTDSSRFSATTDCNNIGGSYTVDGNSITFSEIFSTKMFCSDSQEAEFIALLDKVKDYEFTSKGELMFGLTDGGEMSLK